MGELKHENCTDVIRHLKNFKQSIVFSVNLKYAETNDLV